MRNRSPANSADSSPPVPARTSRKMLRSSFGSRGSSACCSSASSRSHRRARRLQLLVGVSPSSRDRRPSRARRRRRARPAGSCRRARRPRRSASACSRDSLRNCVQVAVAFSAASRRVQLLQPLDQAVELGAQRGFIQCDAEQPRERSASARRPRRSPRRAPASGACRSLLVRRLRQRFQHLASDPRRARAALSARSSSCRRARSACVAQRADQRHRLAQPHPVHEMADLVVDDRLGLRDRERRASRLRAARSRQVVDRVEEHVVELADLGLDVARHREVDHEHRPAAARLQRALDQALAEDRQRGSRCRTPRCRARAAARRASRSSIARALKRSASACARSSVRLATVMRAGRCAAKCVARELDHLARADEQHALVLEAREDALGELHRGGGHRNAVARRSGRRCAPPSPPRRCAGTACCSTRAERARPPRAVRAASFIWPRICGSPSTIESRPEATRNAWRTACSCGSV